MVSYPLYPSYQAYCRVHIDRYGQRLDALGRTAGNARDSQGLFAAGQRTADKAIAGLGLRQATAFRKKP
jgi:hypothetical protein